MLILSLSEIISLVTVLGVPLLWLSIFLFIFFSKSLNILKFNSKLDIYHNLKNQYIYIGMQIGR
jgi:hypothetical protein